MKDNRIENDCLLPKITKIEQTLSQIANQLHSEILSRKQLEESSYKNTEFFNKKILNLESTFSHYDIEINKTFERLHREVGNDMNIKNGALIKMLKPKSERNTNECYSEMNDPNVKYDQYIKNEFMQYRTELNTLVSRLTSTEINIDKKIESLTNEIENIKKDISFIRNSIDDIMTHSTQVDNSSALYKSEIEKNIKSINSCLSQIINNDLPKHENVLNSLISTQRSNSVQSESTFVDIRNKIQSLDDDLNKKLRQLKETRITQMNNQNKEIDNFETHVLSEHESFTKVVRVSIEEDTNKMKGYFEYTKEDVELIRNRCSYIENSLNKLRGDIYESIKQSESFLLQKIDKYTN